jgi:hypothetical protein
VCGGLLCASTHLFLRKRLGVEDDAEKKSLSSSAKKKARAAIRTRKGDTDSEASDVEMTAQRSPFEHEQQGTSQGAPSLPRCHWLPLSTNMSLLTYCSAHSPKQTTPIPDDAGVTHRGDTHPDLDEEQEDVEDGESEHEREHEREQEPVRERARGLRGSRL